MIFSLQLKEILRQTIQKEFHLSDVESDVVVQENPAFGDYSSSVALILAKRVGQSAMEIGEVLSRKLQEDNVLGTLVERIEIAKPGFLNFFLHQKAIIGQLQHIFAHGFEYENVGKGEKLQLEFVSANPTGPLTLGNGRAGFFGDVLGRVLQKSGYEVEREYYVNDAGNQIETLGKSVSAVAGKYQPKDEEVLYRGDYIADLARKYQSEVERLTNRFEQLGQVFVEKELLESIQKSLETMGVGFDRFTSEQKDIRDRGFVQRFLTIARQKGLVYEQDGATWLKTTDFGDDKDRVLVTSDGQYTYLAVDAGHYLETVERGFVDKINILGADHHGYVSRIQAVAKIVGLVKSEIIIMQLVKLVRGGEEVRMSKRKGMYVTIQEVIEEIGADVARYYFLTRAPDSQLTIDLDLAKKESKENPVFYLQYATARLSSILRKIPQGQQEAGELEVSDLELPFVKKIVFWNEVVYRACRDRYVHPLATFVYELADSFHEFYEKCRVLEGEVVNPSRLSLTLLYKKAFLEVFEVLGVKFLEKM